MDPLSWQGADSGVEGVMKSPDETLAEQIITELKKEKINIKPLLEKLENSAWIRNQVGCHFNVSSTVADNQITTFANDTISLANAVVCSQCGEVSRRNIDGMSWDCKCSKSKLQPLVIPGGMTSAIGGVE